MVIFLYVYQVKGGPDIQSDWCFIRAARTGLLLVWCGAVRCLTSSWLSCQLSKAEQTF
jgi:hypothetical protein